MQTTLCDLCKTKPACSKIKVKISQKGFRTNIGLFWTPWEQIDVCADCGMEILKTMNFNPNDIPKSISDKINP